MLMKSPNHAESVYLEMLSRCLDSESVTDLTFHCFDGSKVHAHKYVIAQVSSLIRTFISKSEGDRKERIHISLEGADGALVRALLKLLYSGEVSVQDSTMIAALSELCSSLDISMKNATKVPLNPPPSPSQAPPVYCICRAPEKGCMIGCDFCDEWYHAKCINLNKEMVKILRKRSWKCVKCESKPSKSPVSNANCEPSSESLTAPMPSNGFLENSIYQGEGESVTQFTSAPCESQSDLQSDPQETYANDKSNPNTRLIRTSESLSSGTAVFKSKKKKSSKDDLSFCYSCCSIFVSKEALENHQLKVHNTTG